MASKSGRVIFIGNIPYGLTEEQIVHIFSQAGQVLNFRLVYDKDTGKPKGFGFAEFADADTAAAAVRNINDYEIMGRRLRVDYSNDGGAGDHAPAGYSGQQGGAQHQQQPSMDGSQLQAQAHQLPPLPAGTDLPAGLTCPDAISQTLSTLPPPQLLDILSQMKGLVSSDPIKATELLRQAPQLSYAIFQALLLLGLVDTSVLATVVDSAQQQQQPQLTQLQQPQQYAQQQYIAPQQPQQQFPPQLPPHMQHLAQSHVPTPPPVQQYQAPQPPPQQQPQVQALPDQAALIAQILSMSQQQIDAMPPAERNQIMQVRQQLRMQGYG